MDELTVDGLIEWHEEQLAGAAKSLQAWRSDPAPTNDTRYFLRRYGEDHAFHTNAVELLKKQKELCGVSAQSETGVASQLLGGEQRFFLSTDGDSHWYLVPEANRAEWQAWADLDPDDERAWEPPAYAKPLGGGPQGITFTNPQGLL